MLSKVHYGISHVLFVVLFCFFSNIITINAATITGIVVDKEGSIPLPGAKVKILDTKLGKITNNKGEFEFTNVKSGEYIISIKYIGYQNYETKLTLNENENKYFRIELMLGTVKSGEVYVLGDGLKGQARALNQQKENMNVSNIISSDQVGRFPDANIGDALKRVQGITVQYDQGEARFGLVRGTAARLNSVTINGDRIPSAEAENREVQLDLIPSDMIQTIEVNKVLTPDMDADAVGGSINLVTRGAPQGERISITGASGYNFLSSQPIWTGGLIYGNRFLDDKIGLILSGSYNNHILGSDNIEAEWDLDDNDNPFLSDLQIRRYDVQRVRQSVSAGLDFKIDNSNHIFFNTIFNWRDDWENRYRANYRFDGPADANGIAQDVEIRRETKGGIGNDRVDNRRLEAQKTNNISLSGKHLFGDLKINWQGNMASASETRPNERYISFRTRGQLAKIDISNPKQPNASLVSGQDGIDYSTWSLREITEQNGFTEDLDLNGKIDFDYILNKGDFESTIKFGGRFRSKEKSRNNSFSEFEPIDNSAFNPDDFSSAGLADYARSGDYLAGDYNVGSFASEKFLGSLDLNNPEKFEKTDLPEEYAAGNFNATEDIFGGYLMLTQKLGGNYLNENDNLTMLAGVRFENTSINYKGNKFVIEDEIVTPTEGASDYSNLLPSVQFKYNYSPNLVTRLAWTNTLARPNYYDLVPYQNISLDDNEISLGNPDLKPTESMNIDFMVEYYFESVGIFSVGLFNKNLKNFTYTYILRGDAVPVIDGVKYDRYTKPLNGDEATITGFEFGFQRQLDFLPSFLKNLHFYANYTNTGSNVSKLPTGEEIRQDVELVGTAEHMLNGSLSYEDEQFTARLSVNYTSDYVDEYGEAEFFDRYYDTQTFVDFNVSYKFLDNLRVFLEANNLTNQPLRYYQGIQDRTMQAEYYNTRFNFGVKYDL